MALREVSRRVPGPRSIPPASLIALTVLALLLVPLPPSAAQPATWEAATSQPVLTGLEGPIDIALAEDGSVWWNAYYSGNVSRHDPNGTTEVLFHADPIEHGVERGLVGLGLHPNVTENGVFYVYYTVPDPEDPDGGTNRLSKIADGQEEVLLTVPAFKRHNGGRILFVPDGTMFVSTGDNEEGTPAQDPSSRLGKILHLTEDGQPAGGTIEGAVYSMGHRNVYGLAYDAAGQRLFATENNNAERDEVNLIRAGGNYGWPHCAGTVAYSLEQGRATDEPCEDERFIEPIGEFTPNGTVAPTGAAFVDGALYWASWNQGEIHRMVNTSTGEGWRDSVVHSTGGRINDLEVGPDGDALYYANWTGIHRIELPVDASGPGDAGTSPGDGPSGGNGDGGGAGDGRSPGPGAGTDPGGQAPGAGALLAAAAVLAAALAWRRRGEP